MTVVWWVCAALWMVCFPIDLMTDWDTPPALTALMTIGVGMLWGTAFRTWDAKVNAGPSEFDRLRAEAMRELDELDGGL